MSEDECDRFYRLSAAEKAERFATMSESDRDSYVRSMLRRLADLALEPPKLIVKADELKRFDYDKNNYAMNGGMEVTPKGRIWVTWIGGEDGPKAFMMGAWSDDGGKTFTKPKFAVDPHFPHDGPYYLKLSRNCIMGLFWMDPEGALHFFTFTCVVSKNFDHRGSSWEFVCRNPDDPEPVWSKARYIGYGEVKNRPFIDRDGRWLLPMSHCGDMRLFPENGKAGAWLAASTDKGKSWKCLPAFEPQKVKGFEYVDHFCENAVVQQPDGRLWMMVRSNACFKDRQNDFNGLMEVFSGDGGRTWENPRRCKELGMIMSRFAFIRLKSGNLLFIKHGRHPTGWPERNAKELKETNPWTNHYTMRRELTAFISRDEGKTWEGGLLLEPEEGMISYPDAVQAADGTIYVNYDFERTIDGQIRLARFTEEDVLAGKLVDKRSFVGRVGIRPVESERAKSAKKGKKQ